MLACRRYPTRDMNWSKIAIAEQFKSHPVAGGKCCINCIDRIWTGSRALYFYGFLQQGSKKKKAGTGKVKKMESTWIVYESPHTIER